MPRNFKLWLPVLFWMALIFVFSTDFGSGGNTSRIIGPLLNWLIPDISPARIDLIQTIVRKCGHFTEYAILALLVLRALHHSQRQASAGQEIRVACIALLVSSTYAASDEFHQAFVPTRSASIYDVLIDISGAFTALAVALIWMKFSRKRMPTGLPARRSARA